MKRMNSLQLFKIQVVKEYSKFLVSIWHPVVIPVKGVSRVLGEVGRVSALILTKVKHLLKIFQFESRMEYGTQ